MLLNNIAAAKGSGQHAAAPPQSDYQATMLINLAASNDHLYIHNNVSSVKGAKNNKGVKQVQRKQMHSKSLTKLKERGVQSKDLPKGKPFTSNMKQYENCKSGVPTSLTTQIKGKNSGGRHFNKGATLHQPDQKALMETTQLFFPNHFRRLLSECPPSVRNMHSPHQLADSSTNLKEENLENKPQLNNMHLMEQQLLEVDYEDSEQVESNLTNSNIEEALGHMQSITTLTQQSVQQRDIDTQRSESLSERRFLENNHNNQGKKSKCPLNKHESPKIQQKKSLQIDAKAPHQNLMQKVDIGNCTSNLKDNNKHIVHQPTRLITSKDRQNLNFKQEQAAAGSTVNLKRCPLKDDLSSTKKQVELNETKKFSKIATAGMDSRRTPMNSQQQRTSQQINQNEIKIPSKKQNYSVKKSCIVLNHGKANGNGDKCQTCMISTISQEQELHKNSRRGMSAGSLSKRGLRAVDTKIQLSQTLNLSTLQQQSSYKKAKQYLLMPQSAQPELIDDQEPHIVQEFQKNQPIQQSLNRTTQNVVKSSVNNSQKKRQTKEINLQGRTQKFDESGRHQHKASQSQIQVDMNQLNRTLNMLCKQRVLQECKNQFFIHQKQLDRQHHHTSESSLNKPATPIEESDKSNKQQTCNTLESKSSCALNTQKNRENVPRPNSSKPLSLRDPEVDLKKSKMHIKLGVSPPNGKNLKIMKHQNDSKLISQSINKKLKIQIKTTATSAIHTNPISPKRLSTKASNFNDTLQSSVSNMQCNVIKSINPLSILDISQIKATMVVADRSRSKENKELSSLPHNQNLAATKTSLERSSISNNNQFKLVLSQTKQLAEKQRTAAVSTCSREEDHKNQLLIDGMPQMMTLLNKHNQYKSKSIISRTGGSRSSGGGLSSSCMSANLGAAPFEYSYALKCDRPQSINSQGSSQLQLIEQNIAKRNLVQSTLPIPCFDSKVLGFQYQVSEQNLNKQTRKSTIRAPQIDQNVAKGQRQIILKLFDQIKEANGSTTTAVHQIRGSTSGNRPPAFQKA